MPYLFVEDALLQTLTAVAEQQQDVSHQLLCSLLQSTHRTSKAAPSGTVDLETFFEMPNILLGIVGYDGYLIRVSSSFERLLGYTQVEFQTTPWIAFVHPDDQPTVLAEWNKLVQATAMVEYEGRVVCKDGSEKWFAWTAHVEGEAIYLIAYNVTTHHKTEATITESKEQFRSFFEQPLIGMAITSPTKGVLVVNDKLCEMLDYGREELLRVTWAELTHPDDLVLDVAHFERVVAGEIDGYSIDKRFIRRDGRHLYTIMSCYCLRDRQHNIVHFVALVQDITERKQLEAELRRSLERERDLSSLKSRFVSIVSHEFRNPLATILASTDLLQKYSDRMSEARKFEHLDRIQAQIQHLTGLLEDILTVNRAQAVGLQFNPTGVDLEMLCHDIIADVQAIAPERPIEYGWTCSTVFVLLDVKLIRQALSNLLTNAIKYSPSGKSVMMDVSCKDDLIVLQVRDQGIGIPEDDLPHLFQPFYRASNVGEIAGTGLGLAIVKQAVEAHQGTVAVTSEVGRGTTFTLTLPLRECRVDGQPL